MNRGCVSHRFLKRNGIEHRKWSSTRPSTRTSVCPSRTGFSPQATALLGYLTDILPITCNLILSKWKTSGIERGPICRQIKCSPPQLRNVSPPSHQGVKGARRGTLSLEWNLGHGGGLEMAPSFSLPPITRASRIPGVCREQPRW